MHWPSFFSWKIETVLFFLAEKEKNGFKKPSALWQLPLREIPDDPALRLLTHRADLPCLLGQHDMPAVRTAPDDGLSLFVECAGLHLAVRLAEHVAVQALDLRDLLPERRNVREPFLSGRGGERRIDIQELLVLAVRGLVEVLHRHAVRKRIARRNVDILNRLLPVLLKLLQKLLRMGQLIGCRLLKDARQILPSLRPRRRGVKGVARACL